MLELDSCCPCAEPHRPTTYWNRALPALHTPRQNRILAALPREDYERLLPDLEAVPLPLGRTVYRADEREKHLYFLTAGIVSHLYVTRGGAPVEFAATGNEGVIGIASFLGGESMPNQSVVYSAGYAYRLWERAAKSEFERNGPLAQLLMRYIYALVAQAGQIAVCNRHHSLQQQLCRWLLARLDRMPSSELSMTQDQIADLLGVRRESVTEAAGNLQHAGVIHYSRGRIAVLDRSGLEARVCECYAVVKREYDRLLPQTSAQSRQAEVFA